MKPNIKNTELVITSKTDKIQKLSSSSIILAVGLIMLIIGFLALSITVYFKVVINFASESCHFKFDNIFLNILYCTLSISLLYLIYRYILLKINEKTLLILSILTSLILGSLWINYIKFKPISDQSMVIYCAESILDNTPEQVLNPGGYLNRNPHQLGFVTYIMTIFKLFNTRNPLILQKLNIVFSTINIYLIFLICKKLFKEISIRKILLLLTTVFSIYWTFFNTHVYGNIPGLTFSLIATLFTLKYLDNNKFYNIIILAFSIAIAYLLKSNYEIFLIAIAIILILHTIKNKSALHLINIALIFVTVFSSKSILYNFIEYTTQYSLDTGVDMLAYVYMGIAEPVTLSPGWYTADVENIYNQSNFDKNTSKDLSKNLLINRLHFFMNDWNYTFKYFSSKLQTTWLNPTFQVFWCSTPSIILDVDAEYNNYIANQKLLISILTGTAYKMEENILDVYQIITFIFAGIGLLISCKEGDLKKSLLPLIFLGGFIFHTIWETKSIYVIQYFYIMLPFSALGLYKFFNKIDCFLAKDEESPLQTPCQILEFKKK